MSCLLSAPQAPKSPRRRVCGAPRCQHGLHLSEAKPALVELAENGETVDFSGDDASNNANHNRRHNACFTAWYNAISAVRVATTQTVLGDKAHGALTKQFNDFNDGHVVDIAEIGSGDTVARTRASKSRSSRR